MKYIKKYSSFMVVESSNLPGKRLILLSGPSASGKSTLAINKLGATHWHESLSPVVLIGTDNFIGDREIFEKMKELCRKAGMPALADMMPDWPHVFDQYKEEFAEWRQSASSEEQAIFDSLSKRFPIDKASDNAPHFRQDGRICAMAWCAALLPEECETVIFDDISVGIKKYLGVEEWVLFTPLDWLLKNIASRNEDEDERVHIDVNGKGSALYQYCDWWQASAKPDLDNKMYTAESARQMLLAAGHSDPDEILSLLGAKGRLEHGFYISAKEWIDKGSDIFNTRDEPTGKAKAAPSSL